ncbi:MAG: DNA polymerase III subunit alpha, partial [Clostridiales bacterium]|nr:DNA polymerase III subunit alpha [Candidatus Apopatousia equi]
LMENSNNNFAHLHLHTEYSLLDGAIKIKELVKTVTKLGMPAVAMTDHGNMYGVYKFNKEVIAYNKKVEKFNADPNNTEKMKPLKGIIGCEFYVCPDHKLKVGRDDTSHLILLAKNMEGYRNLCRLNSIAFIDGFYYKPRIDYDLLEKYHEGLICLSACIVGDIPKLILARRFDEAEQLAVRLKNIFKDDFYFEVQNHFLNEELAVRVKLRELGEKLGIKLVATNDCHYRLKEDAEVQDVLMCISMKKTYDDPTRMKFNAPEYYIKTRKEMEEILNGFEDALDNTLEIADKCEQIELVKQDLIPGYTPDDGSTPVEYLRKITEEGLKQKFKEITPEIRERVEYELGLINKMNFTEYFLIVWDFIHYAESHGIEVGPGRGSGAGSIIAYAIGITKVDPLQYQLFFERFINPERVSMPDFDIDFPSDTWIEVRNYCREKYGEDKFCGIVTYGTLAAKAAIKDVARVFRMPFSEVNVLTKGIDPKPIFDKDKLKFIFGVADPDFKAENDDFQEKYDNDLKMVNPELRELYLSDPNIKKIVDIAIKLENMPRQTGQHAAGHIICKKTLCDNIPLCVNSGSDIMLTQFDKTEVEDLGFLKMDYLRINTLNDLREARKVIKETQGIDLDLYKVDYKDKKVYDLISTGNTDAIFQLESEGFKKFMKELKPDCLEDIIAGVALYRPGPMDFCPTYVSNKHNPEQIKYDVPCLEPILAPTYGVIVYQEQVMQIVQAMAGYTLGRADLVRKYMGKKKMAELLKEREIFLHGFHGEDHGRQVDIDGAIKRGASEEVANKIFDMMIKFGQYAFNKSHAAAYAFLTFQTAYLKCYYEKEFLTAVLNNRFGNPDDIKKYILYCKAQGIDVLPPDINKSGTYFTISNGAIRHGLAALKNMGYAISESIIQERKENGDFKDINDLITRMNKYGLNKKGIEALILSGALDCFNKNRSVLMAVFESITERVNSDKKAQSNGQISMFGSLIDNSESVNQVDYPTLPEYQDTIKLKLEKEIIGVYVSGHPLDKYIDKFDKFNFNASMIKKPEDSGEDGFDEDNEIDYQNDSNLVDKMPVSCGGIINEIRKTFTKKDNREMAFLIVEDLFGTYDVMIPPQAYQKIKPLLKEDVMGTFSGKLSIRYGEMPSVVVDNFVPWEEDEMPEITDEIGQIKVPPKRLFLKFDTTNEELKNNIMDILNNHIGESEVYIRCSTTNKAFKLNTTVKYDNLVEYELLSFLPSQNIKFE